jgi:hypothetical protein
MRCYRCEADFIQTKYWQRFCCEECRKEFHAEEAKRGRELVRLEREQAERAA